MNGNQSAVHHSYFTVSFILPLMDFSAERSLLFFCLINLALFGSTWFFASRRLTRSRSQAVLDAALLGYGVQYTAVGLAGFFDLTPACIFAVAMIFVAVFLAVAWRTKPQEFFRASTRDRLTVGGVSLFVISLLLVYAHSQSALPVGSNDALTYHFPAAVQWLQQRHIGLFQTWFFNPANTYSPLAGSMFIVWMIAPFGSDVLARFVEVPALVCVGIAMYCLSRELGARAIVAVLIAGSAMLARPLFLPSMMGKDDLFVAFFFAAILVALSPKRAVERWGPMRLGIALGLLLATKCTALLSVPILLLAIDGPRWRRRDWAIAIGIAILLAGPWYFRNWILTGNPLFPLFSLFTTAPSETFQSLRGAIAVIFGAVFGLPYLLMIPLAIVWLACCVWAVRSVWSQPILRACVIGIIPGLALFFLKSPFPEVRFVLPIFLLMFACSAFTIERFSKKDRWAISIAGIVFGCSLCTLFATEFFSVIAGFSAVALLITVPCVIAIWWAGHHRVRWIIFGILAAAILCICSYINWRAYCRGYFATLYDDGGLYSIDYPDPNLLWRFVNQNIPADATVAYTNMYLIYPLQGPALQRRLVYAPTRSGVATIADLGWLGKNLPGEQLVRAAVRATIASPDRQYWMKNLQRTHATYLIIGRGGIAGTVPESKFVAEDLNHFSKIYGGLGGTVYEINWSTP